MRKLFVLMAAGVGILGAAGSASAQCTSPFCGGETPPSYGPMSHLFHKRPVPAFQAAPWYLYFPYQAHFQSVAPLPGTNGYPGAGYGGAGVNPYFPSAPAPAAAPGQ
jgi:hypothetical protein